MSHALLPVIIVSLTSVSALVEQKGRDRITLSYGQEKLKKDSKAQKTNVAYTSDHSGHSLDAIHDLHRLEAGSPDAAIGDHDVVLKDKGKQPQDKGKQVKMGWRESSSSGAGKKLASLLDLVERGKQKETKALSDALLTPVDMGGLMVPTITVVVAAAVLVVVLAFVLILYNNAKYDAYRGFGNKSGLSTSSSDLTSSETCSTDKELKSRMERFEKRLEEHKRLLEEEDGPNPTLAQPGSGVQRPTWMDGPRAALPAEATSGKAKGKASASSSTPQ